MEDYIKLLDLNPEEFNLADLKKAYRKKVLQYHPDKAANEAERIGYEATMKKLNEANAYIKEYLENHEGRYSKSEYYNTNSSSDDTEEYTTEDNTYSDEETEDESSYEEEKEEESEYYDEEETEEEQTEDTEEETIGLWEECVRAFKEGYNKNKSSETTIPKVQYTSDTKIFMVIMILIIIGSWLICSNLDKEDNTPPPQQTTQQKNAQQTEQQEQITQVPQAQQEEEQNKDVVISKDSTLGRYIAYSSQQVVNNWRLPSGTQSDSIRAKVRFKIFKDGNLIGEPKIEKSSEDYLIDKSCIRAVIYSAPFKPIPEELNKDYLDIELSFEADKKQ